MRYRHKVTGDVLDVRTHQGEPADIRIENTILGVADGDRIFRLPDRWEKAPADHPMWADYDEVVETRVVKVKVGKTTTYHAERLTETGWVRGAPMATMAEAEADMPQKPVETVVKEFAGGALASELVVGDNPATPQVETSWWRRALAFVGFGDAA